MIPINNTIFKIIIGLLIIFSLFLLLDNLGKSSNIDLKLKEIESEFKGKIIKKYAIKNTPPTHLKVLMSDGKHIDISPNQLLVKDANVGDSLIKLKNENVIFLVKGEERIRFFYTKISYETRNSNKFPVAWKNK